MQLFRRVIVIVGTTLAIAVSSCAFAGESVDQLVVHEWGTFTELQDALGISIGGVNTDDEPVPEFVHRIGKRLLQSTNEPWRSFGARLSKSVAWSDRITTRLETPVIYFYPPAHVKEPLKVDVDVQLRGGWLTEYFPNADANAPGLRGKGLDQHAVGSLAWHGLQIGGKGEIPETKEHVWLAPRGPESARVVNSKGEAEEYLFYRGVGRFSGPLRIETEFEKDTLRLKSRFQTLDLSQPVSIPAAWLVEVNKDGLAYRRLPAMEVPAHHVAEIQEIRRSFHKDQFSVGNLEIMRQEMHQALVEDGLFADEATAMLATWDNAYFHSHGKRLFYLLPKEWTDDRMPLTISVPAQIDRVMMGRIELITDRQRELLKKLSNQAPSSREWMKQLSSTDAGKEFLSGNNSRINELGEIVPDDYAAYIELGRFRNSLIHMAYQKTKNANLKAFMKTHGLLTKEMIAQQRTAAVTRQASVQSQ